MVDQLNCQNLELDSLLLLAFGWQRRAYTPSQGVVDRISWIGLACYSCWTGPDDMTEHRIRRLQNKERPQVQYMIMVEMLKNMDIKRETFLSARKEEKLCSLKPPAPQHNKTAEMRTLRSSYEKPAKVDFAVQ